MAGERKTAAAGGNPAAAEAQAAAEAADTLDALDGVELVMLITITGLRDGEPWPEAGESITLPAEEAALYVANGYAKLAE